MSTQQPAAEAIAEAISAFVDSESDDLERRRVADRLLEDSTLRATFARYQLIGALLRQEPYAAPDDAPLSRLQATIASEPARSFEWPVPVRTSTPERRRWLASAVGLATAAGVAAALVLGGFAPRTAQDAQVAVLAPAVVVRSAAAPSSFDAERRTRLYMLMHAQQTGLSQNTQGLPLVKFVSYQVR